MDINTTRGRGGNLAEAYHLATAGNAHPSADSLAELFEVTYNFIYNTNSGADPEDVLHAVIEVAKSVRGM